MSPKSEPHPPFVSSFPPIDAFMETKGNQSGNEIVSMPKTPFLERSGFPEMETRKSEPLETKHAKNGPFVSISFPSETP